MRRYRIGFDMTVLWAVTDRNNVALPLEGKEVHLYYTNSRGRYEANIQIQDGNVVVWTFLGKDQRTLGNYTLTLEIIQPYGTRSIKIDKCGAFALVGRTCEDNSFEGEANINNGGEITLASELDIYRIQPIVPEIGENKNWWIDGVDTGKPARGEKGDAVEVAYIQFEVDKDMHLVVTHTTTNDQLNVNFQVDDNGNLIISK